MKLHADIAKATYDAVEATYGHSKVYVRTQLKLHTDVIEVLTGENGSPEGIKKEGVSKV